MDIKKFLASTLFRNGCADNKNWHLPFELGKGSEFGDYVYNFTPDYKLKEDHFMFLLFQINGEWKLAKYIYAKKEAGRKWTWCWVDMVWLTKDFEQSKLRAIEIILEFYKVKV